MNTGTSISPGDMPYGTVNTDAAAVMMVIDYAARVALFGLLRVVGALARS